MHVKYAMLIVAGGLLVSASGFAVGAGGGEDLSAVPFEETLSTGLTGVDVQQAESQGYAIPKGQVFYSQYEYVVGYYGMGALVDSIGAEGRAEQFGHPLAVFVTDFSGTEPSLTDEGYIQLGNSLAEGWVRADHAAFVLDSGARTPGGPAVLPFSDRTAAERFAERHGGDVVDWGGLRSRLAGDQTDPSVRLDEHRAERQEWADERVADTRSLLDRPESVVVSEDAPTLAAAIEQAPPNTTVRLPPGTYEVNLTVEKPVTITGAGEDTVLTGDGNGTVLTVRSPGVAVTSLRVTGIGDTRIGEVRGGEAWDDRIRLIYGRGDAGIRLADARGALVQNVSIDTPANGIVALNSTGAVVRDVTVHGSDRPAEGFMGVLAMYSEMVVERSEFVNGRDGVYTHYSDGIVVRDNRMRSLRYGLHEMYTSDTLVANNTVSDAEVGVIVMTRPAGNALVGNRVRDAEIGLSTAGSSLYAVENEIADVGVALSIGTDRSFYARNTLVDSEVGIRSSTLLPTNTVIANDVVGNNRAVEMSTSGARDIWASEGRGNYWGDIPGLDRNGDGIIDRSYRPDDAVDRHASDSAGGVALARSPAVDTLRQFQQAVPGLRGSSVVDPAPISDPVRPEALDRVRDSPEGRR
jgi:nitrous oxidase accessory protein NosD/nitrous oxide reductase accessory protein NosL